MLNIKSIQKAFFCLLCTAFVFLVPFSVYADFCSYPTNYKYCDPNNPEYKYPNLCSSDAQCKSAITGDPLFSDPCVDIKCDLVTQKCSTKYNSAFCEDGNKCTLNDRCQDGACTAGQLKTCNDSDSCTDDTCDTNTGNCVFAPKSCSDGNLCTDDGCNPLNGDCVFTAKTCNDGKLCTTDTCNPSTGCVFTNKNCNDGNRCTVDSCDATNGQCKNIAKVCEDSNACTNNNCDPATGNCVFPAISCDDGDVCTTDSCDVAKGCQHQEILGCCKTGKDCGDGSVCTTDTCVLGRNGVGTCQHTNISCSDGNACTTDSCDPAQGCKFTNNTDPCDDGLFCTEGDKCSNGSCAGSAKVCSDLKNCTTDACDEAGDKCVFTAVKVDDGDKCTDDSCDPATGKAVNTPKKVDDGSMCTTDSCNPLTGEVIHEPIMCNDNNGCTDDSCDPAKGCNFANNMKSCDDGNLCTTDMCSGGLCVGTPKNCNDNDKCTDDTCDAATGQCKSTNKYPLYETECTVGTGDCAGVGTYECKADGTGVECSAKAKPDGTACATDNNPCTTDTCQAGTCSHANNTDPCDDGLFCTEGDKCGNGSCAGSVKVCSDLKNCTTDACDEAGDKCVFTAVKVDDGDKCTDDSCDPATGKAVNTPKKVDDGSMCTTDSCNPLTGEVIHEPIMCNDNNGCTDDSCDPAKGCAFANNMKSCDDGNLCTTDMCSGGLCVGTPKNCNDNDKCTDDTCDAATGQCKSTNKYPLYKTECTVGTGDCAGVGTYECKADGTGVECSAKAKPDGTACATDNNPCTTDTCQAGECGHANNTDPCDDGLFCTEGDKCGNGSCAGSVKVCSDLKNCTTDACDEAGDKCVFTAVKVDDGDKCTDDSCDPATGKAVNTPKKVDDGSMCTTDSCNPLTGEVIHEPIMCNDNNGCTDDSCDPAKGCAFANNMKSCDDGNLCTTDMCSGGLCVGTPKNCNDNDKCTDDTCDAATGQCKNADKYPLYGESCTVGTGDCAGVGTYECKADGTGVECSAKAKLDGTACATDNNLCTTDTCQAGKCGHANNTDPCNDGLFCTEGDKCGNGSCAGSAKVCSDLKNCTTDACDEAGDKCVFTAVKVDDGDKCTDDSCDPATGKAVNTPKKVDDSNKCTTDSCNPLTGEVTNTLMTCDDNNECTDDSCDPVTGCGYVNNAKPCKDDDNACTNDVCSLGVCNHYLKAGCCLEDKECEDNNACTINKCENNKCVFPSVAEIKAGCKEIGPDGCEDTGTYGCKADKTGLECEITQDVKKNDCGSCGELNVLAGKLGDTCSVEGECKSGKVVCNWAKNATICQAENKPDLTVCGAAKDACHKEALCKNGLCEAGLPIDGCCLTNAECDDNSICTTDLCGANSCKHNPIDNCCVADGDCDDLDACTDDKCAGNRCEHKLKVCDDGDLCNGGERCDKVAGCVNGNPVVCEEKECMTGVCRKETGKCEYTKINGCCSGDSECGVSDACNKFLCVENKCQAKKVEACCLKDEECSDGKYCTKDRCNPAVNKCENMEIKDCCESVGLAKSCADGFETVAGIGVCEAGTRTCLNNHTWEKACAGAVEPSNEICDGKDNNCNGQTDENFSGLGGECSDGKGECVAKGEIVCSENGQGTVCNAKAGEPNKEICDNKDNNCNGEIDEGFNVGEVCVNEEYCDKDLKWQCSEVGDKVCIGLEKKNACNGCGKLQISGVGEGSEGEACVPAGLEEGTYKCGVWKCSEDKLTLECKAEEGEKELCGLGKNACKTEVFEQCDKPVYGEISKEIAGIKDRTTILNGKRFVAIGDNNTLLVIDVPESVNSGVVKPKTKIFANKDFVPNGVAGIKYDATKDNVFVWGPDTANGVDVLSVVSDTYGDDVNVKETPLDLPGLKKVYDAAGFKNYIIAAVRLEGPKEAEPEVDGVYIIDTLNTNTKFYESSSFDGGNVTIDIDKDGVVYLFVTIDENTVLDKCTIDPEWKCSSYDLGIGRPIASLHAVKGVQLPELTDELVSKLDLSDAALEGFGLKGKKIDVSKFSSFKPEWPKTEVVDVWLSNKGGVYEKGDVENNVTDKVDKKKPLQWKDNDKVKDKNISNKLQITPELFEPYRSGVDSLGNAEMILDKNSIRMVRFTRTGGEVLPAEQEVLYGVADIEDFSAAAVADLTAITGVNADDRGGMDLLVIGKFYHGGSENLIVNIWKNKNDGLDVAIQPLQELTSVEASGLAQFKSLGDISVSEAKEGQVFGAIGVDNDEDKITYTWTYEYNGNVIDGVLTDKEGVVTSFNGNIKNYLPGALILKGTDGDKVGVSILHFNILGSIDFTDKVGVDKATLEEGGGQPPLDLTRPGDAYGIMGGCSMSGLENGSAPWAIVVLGFTAILWWPLRWWLLNRRAVRVKVKRKR